MEIYKYIFHSSIRKINHIFVTNFNPLSPNPTKSSNTLEQFVGKYMSGHFVELGLNELMIDKS